MSTINEFQSFSGFGITDSRCVYRKLIDKKRRPSVLLNIKDMCVARLGIGTSALEDA